MNETLKKRLLSFVWRLGVFLLVGGLGWIANNIGDLGLPDWLVTVVAMACRELTKYINSK